MVIQLKWLLCALSLLDSLGLEVVEAVPERLCYKSRAVLAISTVVNGLNPAVMIEITISIDQLMFG